MRDELVKEATFDVEIKTPSGYKLEEKGIEYMKARALCEKALAENPNDELLQEQLLLCIDSFGFRGFGGGGGYSITINAYRPMVETGEEHLCPERMEGPFNLPEKDTWRMIGKDKCCSYCDSLHPDRVLELVKEQGFGIIEQTIKGYKWYINQKNVPNASFGGIKYYRAHDTKEFIDGLNELYRQSKQVSNGN